MAPAASIVFGLGLVLAYAGAASPFSMVLGCGAALLIAVCVGQLARHISSAGGVYSYAATALGDTVGFLVGWAYTLLFLMIICLVAISFGLVGTDFIGFYLDIDVPEWVLSIALIAFALTMTYRGVRPSTTVTAILAVAEVVLLLLVALFLIIEAGSSNTWTLFDPRNAGGLAESGTARAVFLGVVFAFSLVSGFESAAPLAEETKDPRRVLPRAVLLAAGGIGLFYVITSYAAVVGWGVQNLGTFLDSPNPWREMAGQVNGSLAFLVVLAILNSQIAGMQAAFNVTSRLLFSMSRNEILPPGLSRVHPVRKSPHIAAVMAAGLALIVTFGAKALFDGAFTAYIFFVTTMTVIFLLLYVSISLATARFYLTKVRDEFNPLLHLLVPGITLAILGAALYYSLKGLTHPADLALPAVLVWLLLGAIVLLVLRTRGVDVSAERRRWLGSEDERIEGHPAEQPAG